MSYRIVVNKGKPPWPMWYGLCSCGSHWQFWYFGATLGYGLEHLRRHHGRS